MTQEVTVTHTEVDYLNITSQGVVGFNVVDWERRFEEVKRRALSLDLTALPDLRQLVNEAEAALGQMRKEAA